MRPDWIEIRAKYEAGASQGSLAKKYGISRTAIGKHVQSEGWTQDVSRSIQQKVDAKVAGIVAGGNPKKTAEALDLEAQKRADLIIAHRKEWEVVGGLRNMALECINRSKGNDNPVEAFERMKLAKITAEMTAIKQQGERKAWNIDAPPAAINITTNAAAVATNGDEINYDEFTKAFSAALGHKQDGLGDAAGDGIQ